MKRISLKSLLTVILLLAGCATIKHEHPYDDEVYASPRYGIIGVASTDDIPIVENQVSIRGKGQGTLATAGGFGLGCMTGGLPGFILSPFCALIGAAVGSVAATPLSELESTEARVSEQLGAASFQEPLAMEVLRYGREMRLPVMWLPSNQKYGLTGNGTDYSRLDQPSPDLILETTIQKITIKGMGFGEVPFNLIIQARSRLIRQYDNHELISFTHEFHTDEHELMVWAEAGAVKLQQAIQTAYRILAEQAVDQLLLVMPFPSRDYVGHQKPEATKHSRSLPRSVLYPIDPILRPSTPWERLSEPYAPSGELFVEVKTSQPTFRWEALQDLIRRQSPGLEVHSATYDLEIYTSRKDQHHTRPAERIYSRSGLSEPQHTPAISLHSCGRFFWSVRARFLVEGMVKMTEWSGAYGGFALMGETNPEKFRRVAHESMTPLRRQDFAFPIQVIPVRGACQN